MQNLSANTELLKLSAFFNRKRTMYVATRRIPWTTPQYTNTNMLFQTDIFIYVSQV